MRYRAEIDGLRAVAIVAVVLHHLGISWLPGGYLGVDVFFVISGFLITSLLHRELEAGTFSLGRFWQRRVRRLFPAAGVMMAVSTVGMYLLLFRLDVVAFLPQQRAALLGYANFYFWPDSGGNYWSLQWDHPPYLHFWSLAVEEQFYVLAPLGLWALWRWQRRNIQWWLGGAVLIGLVLFAAGMARAPTATFFLLPGRAWELGLGCWLAGVKPRLGLASRWADALTGVGLGLIGVMYVLPGHEGILGPEVIGAVGGAALVIAGGSNRLSRRMLEHRWVVYVGKVSYSLYLWHWVVICVFKEQPGLQAMPFTMGWAVVIFTLASVVSYHWVEKPTRAWRGKRAVWTWVGAYGLLLLALLGGTWLTPPNYAEGVFARARSYQAFYDVRPRHGNDTGLGKLLQFADAPSHTAPEDAYLRGGIIVPGRTALPEVVLLGDSHAVMWGSEIAEQARQRGLTCSLWAMNSGWLALEVPPVRQAGSYYITSEERYGYDVQRLALLREWRPKLVFLGSRWETGVRRPANMKPLLAFLEGIAEHVVLIESPPVLARVEERNATQYLAYLGLRPNGDDALFWPHLATNDGAQVRRELELAVGEVSNAQILDVADLFVKGDQVRVAQGDEVLYMDDDHLVCAGTELARPRIEAIMDDVFGPSGNP